MAQWMRICLPMQEKQEIGLSLGDPLEEEVVTQSGILV